jgi:hypothetical protein
LNDRANGPLREAPFVRKASMTVPPRLFKHILPITAAALLFVSIAESPFAPASGNGAVSAVPSWGDGGMAPQVDRSRKGDRLRLTPAAQTVNTTFIPRVFAPAATFPDMNDREHVPARGPAPLADCVGQASPAADAIMGRDISSCFV